MKRTTNIQQLRSEYFDLCIIGGGASGAGCALDASLRGLKVALIEKTDFAAETSSKSTKLIHGGVRYLEQAFKKLDFAQLRQVRHGLEERHTVLRNAPHLAHPLALLTPVSGWLESWYYGLGLKMYDWFASGKDTLPKSRRLSKSEALQLIPGLSRHIHSAVLYYDGQLDDARYCLALVQSAVEAGACVANHLELTGFDKNSDGQITAAVVRDRLLTASEQSAANNEFRIRARMFLNCTGPYADQVRHFANPRLDARVHPSKGVHMVLPETTLGSDAALLIPSTKDGRVIFAIPFEGALLLGTTDDECRELEKEPALEASEVDFLLDTLQPFVAQKIDRAQIKAGFGGLRPLVRPTRHRAGKAQTKSLLRDHEVEYDPASHLLSLLGGKWTTYRLMAKDAVDATCKFLGIEAECRTEMYLLAGAKGWDNHFWKKIAADYGFDADISQHLALKYGVNADKPALLARENRELSERLIQGFPYLKAEVVYTVRHEMACTLRDFLARRIRLEITDWQSAKDCAPIVAALMGKELGWPAEMQQREAEAYQKLLEGFSAQADLNHDIG